MRDRQVRMIATALLAVAGAICTGSTIRHVADGGGWLVAIASLACSIELYNSWRDERQGK